MEFLEKYPNIKSFAFIPDKAIDSYRELRQEASTSSYVVREEINDEYLSAAKEKGTPRIIFKKDGVAAGSEDADHVYIVTNVRSASDETPIVIVFIPNRNSDRQPWEMQKAVTEGEYNSKNYVELGDKPSEALINYAYWASYVDDLKTLKNDIALPENWSYKENPNDNDFPILKSYMKYTFYKQHKDKQIFVSEDRRYSVFNTGLANKNYKYIYAIFEHNKGSKPWKFCMFACSGVKAGGRILADNFPSLPPPARYFNDISDISYIINPDKTPNEQLPELQLDHYFVDNPSRLPRHFLLDGCRKNSDLLELLNTDLGAYNKEELQNHWKAVGEKISNDQDVYYDLEAAFINAVRKAVMRVSWNYRTAIPVYFPSHNKMSILLPLSFRLSSDAEVALVVERNPVSKKYTAPTILSLPMAYANARLVCKPESDWLNQKVLEPVMSDEASCIEINELME